MTIGIARSESHGEEDERGKRESLTVEGTVADAVLMSVVEIGILQLTGNQGRKRDKDDRH